MLASLPILSVLIWLPIFGGLLVIPAGKVSVHAVRWLALFVALATFLASIALLGGFDAQQHAMQFRENVPWIRGFLMCTTRSVWTESRFR